MNRIVHFEIHVDNPERAMKFYTEVFGWEFERWGDNEYWMVMTAPKGSTEMGISGGLLPRSGPKPESKSSPTGYVCTALVENLDATAEKIERAGGIIAVPKTALPGMAWQAYYIDTEGNIFGIHQPDTNAK